MSEIVAMAQVEVADLDAFLTMFSTGGLKARRRRRCRGAQVYQDGKNPNALTILFRWSSDADLQGFRLDPKVRETMASSGIVSLPRWTILSLAAALTN